MLEALMGLFVVHQMWGFSGSILRTNKYDPKTDTAVSLLINTSAKGKVGYPMGMEVRAGAELEQQPVPTRW